MTNSAPHTPNRKEYNDETHQEKVRSYFENNVIAPSPSIGGSRQQIQFPGRKSVECQTRISLPLDFNLEGLLGKYLTN